MHHARARATADRRRPVVARPAPRSPGPHLVGATVPAMNGVRSAADASSALPLQWPLVGRHEQLDLFAATLNDPRAHGLVIHGAAGVGKTRLADQCLALADR